MLHKAKVIIFCVIILYCGHVLCETKVTEYLPKTLPNSALYDLKGQEFTLDKLEGNVLLVHFWATWCASCTEELKALNQLQKLLRKDPVIVIPISEDFKGAGVVRSFYNKHNLKFLPAFLDKSNKWFREMKVSSLPATFIIDSQGKNVMLMSEKVDWLDETNISLIKKYISTKQPYNQDYVSLLNEHRIVIDKSKSKKKNESLAQEVILKSIETNVSPEVTKSKLKQGEINMTNPHEKDFTNRRPVNLNYNRNNRGK